MQVREALRKLSGAQRETQWGDGPLGSVAAELLEAFRARQANAAEDAEVRASMMGTGPMLAVLSRRFAEAEAASLLDMNVPMVTRLDAYSALRAASRAAPKDRGLKLATAHAQHLWMKEQDGVLAVGDVARMREHWTRQFPKSAVGAALEGLAKVGFNTLPIQKLAQLATNIGGNSLEEVEASFATVVRAHGLDGDADHARRARAFLCGLVNLSLPDDVEDGRTAAVGGSEAADRTLRRMAAFDDPILRSVTAQGFGAGDVGDDLGGDLGGDIGMGLPDHEDEIPHDEAGGSIVETESPITGEPVVLELEVGEPEGSDPLSSGGLPGDEAMDVTPEDVEGLAHFGQLDDYLPDGSVEDVGGDIPAVDEGGGETVVEIEDPTAPGEMIEVTLAPAGHDEAEEVQPAVDVPMIGDERVGARTFLVYAIRGGVRGDSPLERVTAASMPRALVHIGASLREAGVEHGEVRADPAGFRDRALIVLDQEAGNHLYVVAEDKAKSDPHAGGEEGNEFCPEISPPSAKGPKVKYPAGGAVLKAGGKLDKASVATAAAALGLTAADVTARLLDAEVVSAGSLELEVNNAGALELRRAGRIVRTAELAVMDAVVADFLAASVAEGSARAVGEGRRGSCEVTPLFMVGCASCGRIEEYLMPKVAAAVRCPCGYETSARTVAVQMEARRGFAPGFVLTSDVPGRPEDVELNARRIMGEVMAVVPTATGALREGRLEVELRPADEGALARVRNVLESKFGVALQTRTAQGGATQQEMQSVVPGAVSNLQVQNPISPTYSAPGVQPPAPLGATPAPATPGGGPQINVAAPPQASPQLMAPAPTGEEKQRDFMREHATIKPASRQPLTPIWRVAYREDGRVLHQEVEAVDEAAARRIFAMYDAGEVLEVRRAQALPPPPPKGPPAEPGMDAGPGPGAPPPPDPGMAPPPMGSENGGAITPEVSEAIRAAMATLRNTGVDIASAIDKFQGQFKTFLDSVGDETTPARQALGAEIVKAGQEAWSKPALLDLTQKRALAAHARRLAQRVFEVGNVSVQHGDRVKLPGAKKLLGPDSSQAEPAVLSPKVLKKQPKQKNLSPTDMGGGEEDHEPSFGLGKPPAKGQYGLVGEGTSLTPTDLGGDLAGENSTTRTWDSVSKRAPGLVHSKPGGAGTPKVKAGREAALKRLASLRVKPSTNALYWLKAAAEKAAAGTFPEEELWSARDAGLDQALPRLTASVQATLTAAYEAL